MELRKQNEEKMSGFGILVGLWMDRKRSKKKKNE